MILAIADQKNLPVLAHFATRQPNRSQERLALLAFPGLPHPDILGRRFGPFAIRHVFDAPFQDLNRPFAAHFPDLELLVRQQKRLVDFAT